MCNFEIATKDGLDELLEKEEEFKNMFLNMSKLVDKQDINIHSIVKDFLKNNGFDGLYNYDECGCEIDDLMPCGQCNPSCNPGYKTKGDNEFDFYIVSIKE